MLNYDDLLVARMLNRARPDLTRALSAGLDAIAEGLLEQGLLATLVARGRVDSTAAAQAQGSIASHLGARALEAYVATLGRAGLDLGQVAQQRAQLGDSGTAEALGARLVAAGLLTQERHRAAMNEAAQAEQRLQAEELQRYVEGRRTQLATLGEPQAAPSGAEPAASAGAGAAGPGFAIPDWVDTTDERVGTEVAGYRILGRIGAGAMGIVYLVDHPDQPERPVALKLLLGAQSEEAKGRFKREILANSLFSHEGILEVYDAGETDDGPYLAMEFFDGVNLADLLEVETKPYHALFLARHFFSALGKAHEAG